MESRIKLFGHPIHPMLVAFPLGLLVTAVIFDILNLIFDNTVFSTIAYYNIIAGVTGGLIAAVFGFIDWLSIPGETRAKSIGLVHGIGNAVLVILFAASWFLRMGSPDYAPTTLALVMSFAGAALGTVTAWLGGELVYRLSVGVDAGAHLDAPNSLSGEPALRGVDQRVMIPQTGHHHDEPESSDQ